MSEVADHPVWRSDDGRRPAATTDAVVVEEPLEIRVAGTAVSVTMRTPGHDRELALGFLVSEGLLAERADVECVVQSPGGPGANLLDVRPAPGVRLALDRLTRHVFTSSSCGLCGKTAIEAVRHHFPPIADDVEVDARTLLALPAALAAAQTAFARTGGLHAAAVFAVDGTLVAVREDVGRHNAVDKVIGHGFAEGCLPWRRHMLLVSGRASFEIVQKALAAGIPIVAAVSAPSSLAVSFADESGQTLIGFLRPGRLNVYTHHRRVRFAD
ncbi:MAG TPA: formate dehydrogenase accessory sulfurtransferase FdhD [Candidatus Limnocylindria bacterium]|nr:formate dehydrogenase accessory sulfurtransferase FdhD [Candidatus Limnocylindria bacterium]